VQLSPADLPRLHAVRVNPPVLLFSALLSLATGVVFGFAPAIQGARSDLQQAMRESSRAATASGRVARLRGALVVGQFALALVLLVGAALLVQSMWRLQRVDLGFRPSSVLTLSVWLPQPNDPQSGPYFKHDARVSFYRAALDRLGRLPGVESAGAVSVLPLSGARGRLSFSIVGRADDAGDTPTADGALATPGYFRTLGIDLLRGRLFDDHDDARSRPVAVVSESFARKFFPGEDAVGQRLVPGRRATSRTPTGPLQAALPRDITIVGVVRDVKSSGVDSEPAPTVYRSVWQISNLNLTFAVRATADPASLASLVRREVRAVDPNEPVYAIRTMDTVVTSALGQRRFTMQLLALFAATAFALSAIGIYGVMAFFVAQRTHELGVRIALGATRRDVLQLVMAQGARLTAAGIALGIAGALALTGALGAMLYEVDARDPLTFIVLSSALAGASLAACFVPARRALRVDPITALRYE
jgi:putative ABC transport system permease protein